MLTAEGLPDVPRLAQTSKPTCDDGEILIRPAGPIDAELRDHRMAAAVLAGSVRPVVSATFDFDDIADAFACLDRSITGKVALRISPET